jgi:hypothetical protein
MCEAPASSGQPCGGTAGSTCADGLYCQAGDGGAAGVCQPKASSGACVQQDQCAAPDICSMPGDASTAGQCAPIVYAQPGDPCSPSGNPVCACATTCGADGTCATAPDPGSACDLTGPVPCHGGFCETDDAGGGQCRPVFSATHACTSDAQCGAYGRCSMATLQCIAACY